jgi:hypothetical protein
VSGNICSKIIATPVWGLATSKVELSGRGYLKVQVLKAIQVTHQHLVHSTPQQSITMDVPAESELAPKFAPFFGMVVSFPL